MLNDEEIKQIEEEARLAIIHLQKINEIAEGKDNNVAFLAEYRSSDIDAIVRCAKIKGRNMPK